MPYASLKKMLLVSKVFDNLLAAPSFDSALFRAKKPWTTKQWKENDIELEDVRIHPALAEISAYFDYSYDSAPTFVHPLLPAIDGISNPSRTHDPETKKWNVKQTSIYKESATWPPVSMVNFNSRLGGDYRAHRDQYVLTVSSILRILPRTRLVFLEDSAQTVLGWKAEKINMMFGSTPKISLTWRLGSYVGPRPYIMASGKKYEYVDLLEGYAEFENPAGEAHRRTAEMWTSRANIRKLRDVIETFAPRR